LNGGRALPLTGIKLSLVLEPAMRALSQPAALRVEDPVPFGDVTLVPEAATGRSELEMARAMAEAVRTAHATSDAELLRRLRKTFPYSPLSLRVAALAVLMKRARASTGW
jgi:hypothetical protein